MFKCSLLVQFELALSQIIVLSLAPLRVMPPRFAVASVAPPIEAVAAEEDPLPVSAALSVSCVALLIDATVVFAGTVTPRKPLLAVNAEPTVISFVLARFVTVAEPDVTVHVTVVEATAPISIFLSSTDNVFVLRIVVVPLTVRLPETVRFLVAARSLLMVTVPLAEEEPILMFVVDDAAPLVPILIVLVNGAAVTPVPMFIVWAAVTTPTFTVVAPANALIAKGEPALLLNTSNVV